jgi:hypothetical protein
MAGKAMLEKDNLEVDSTGNPFIEVFPLAVRFKAQYAIDSGFELSQVDEIVQARKAILADEEIEVFLYPTVKTFGKAEEIFQSLSEITAALAFTPNGVTMFGYHYAVIDSFLQVKQINGYAIQSEE